MTTTIQNPTVNKQLKAILNQDNLQVKFNWLSIDQKKRHATIEIIYAPAGSNKFNTLIVEAFINPNLWDWVTLKRNIKINDTNDTLFQTGYQRWLSKIGIPYQAITKIEFDYIPNNHPVYNANPFCITLNKNNIWAVRLVNDTPKDKIGRVNLETGEVNIYYKTKHNPDGSKKFIAPKFYKRISIQ